MQVIGERYPKGVLQKGFEYGSKAAIAVATEA